MRRTEPRGQAQGRSTAADRPRRGRRRRPEGEALDGRLLLTVGPLPTGPVAIGWQPVADPTQAGNGAVVIAGTDARDEVHVTMDIHDTPRDTTDDELVIAVTTGGSTTVARYRFSAVDLVIANLGGGKDRFENDTVKATSVRGGAEADVMIGGPGPDTFRGEDGNDTLHGHGGNDALFGGDGRDELLGHLGDDYLDGGLDGQPDVLRGDQGADTFVLHMFAPFYDIVTGYGLEPEELDDYTPLFDRKKVVRG